MPNRTRISGRRPLATVAGLVIAVGLALTGCEPGSSGTAAATSVTTAAETGTTAPATTTAPPTTPPVTPSSTPPAEPTAAAPAPGKVPAQPVPSKAPATAKATPEAEPAPEPTRAAPAGACEIVSEAGNCYKAGQFCRKADLGRSTHDAGGRMLTCRMVSGKPHWQAD
ncbi:hypothetical protein ACWGB8_13845 [Kitasatospora sp. NPDC054939]